MKDEMDYVQFTECPYCRGKDSEHYNTDLYGLDMVETRSCDDCGKYFERIYNWQENKEATQND